MYELELWRIVILVTVAYATGIYAGKLVWDDKKNQEK